MASSAAPDELAHAVFIPALNETGWNRLHVTANPALPLAGQYRAAGFLEGYVSQPDIYRHFRNFVEGQLGGTNLPPSLSLYVEQQLAFLSTMVE